MDYLESLDITVDVREPISEPKIEHLPVTVCEPASEPVKRGRGRPRLSGKSPKKNRSISAGNIKRERTKDQTSIPKISLPADSLDKSQVYNDPILADSNVPNPLKVRSISTSFQSQRLMSLLLTNPPLTVEDMLKLLPGVILEQLQGMLDALQIFGVVKKVKLRSNLNQGDKSERSSKQMKINNNLNLTQYTVAGFARGLTPVEIKNIQEDTINRHTSAAATYQRIAKIKELVRSITEFDIVSAKNASRLLVNELIAEDAKLKSDSLYLHITNELMT